MRRAASGASASSVAQQQQGDVAAHAGADQHLRALGQLIEDGARLLQPAAHRAVLEPALGLAVARIVEAQAADTLLPRPLRHRAGLDARISDLKPDRNMSEGFSGCRAGWRR